MFTFEPFLLRIAYLDAVWVEKTEVDQIFFQSFVVIPRQKERKGMKKEVTNPLHTKFIVKPFSNFILSLFFVWNVKPF